MGGVEATMKRAILAVTLLGCVQTVKTTATPMRASITEDSATLVTPTAKIYGTLELPAGKVLPLTSASVVIAAEPPTPETGSKPLATSCGA